MLDYLQRLDTTLFYTINGLPHTTLLDQTAAWVHWLTYRGPIYYPLAALFLRLKDPKRRQLVVLGTIAGPVTSFICNIILKPTLHRLRPYQVLDNVTLVTGSPHSFAFPSGQTAVAFAIATLFWRLPFHRAEKLAALAFALLVALDRVYTGHHYPSDVLGGAIVGILIASLTHALFGWRARRIARVPNSAEGTRHA